MTMKNRITTAVALVLTVISLNLNAQNALPFTRIDRNPRMSAFAGAGMASTGNGWYSAFGNAAQLGFGQSMVDAGAGLQLWEMSNEVDKTTNIQAGAAFCKNHFGIALGGAYQMGVMQGTFTPSDRLLSIGLAYNVADVISIGVNARYAAQALTQDRTLSGFSADVTLLGRISPRFTVAAGVGNIGNRVMGSTQYHSQPAFAHAGLSWMALNSSAHHIELLLDAEYNFDGSFAVAIGSEYTYNHLFYVRTGYRLASEKALIPSHLGVGLGVKYEFLRVEASYLAASPVLGNTLNLGVGVSF